MQDYCTNTLLMCAQRFSVRNGKKKTTIPLTRSSMFWHLEHARTNSFFTHSLVYPFIIYHMLFSTKQVLVWKL